MSAGLDGIKMRCLKTARLSSYRAINLILSSGVYPKILKICYIKPLYKADDPTVPGNYRGITVMLCLVYLGKRKVQGVPQSQTAALPRPQEEEETDKSKQAQTEQTYEKH